MKFNEVTITASASKSYQKAEITMSVVLENNETIESAQAYANTLAKNGLDDLLSKVQPAPEAPVSYASRPKAPYHAGAAAPSNYTPTGYSSNYGVKKTYPVSENQLKTLRGECGMSENDICRLQDYRAASDAIKAYREASGQQPSYRGAPTNNAYGYDDHSDGR